MRFFTTEIYCGGYHRSVAARCTDCALKAWSLQDEPAEDLARRMVAHGWTLTAEGWTCHTCAQAAAHRLAA